MKQKFGTLMAALLVLAASGLSSQAGPAEEANAIIDTWVKTYSANDREALVALYSKNAVLLGTTSPLISEGTDAIRLYFQDLDGSGRKNEIVERRTIVLNDETVLGTGFYNFMRESEGNVPRPSRFSVLVAKKDGRWLIVHHHSSPKSATRQ